MYRKREDAEVEIRSAQAKVQRANFNAQQVRSNAQQAYEDVQQATNELAEAVQLNKNLGDAWYARLTQLKYERGPTLYVRLPDGTVDAAPVDRYALASRTQVANTPTTPVVDAPVANPPIANLPVATFQVADFPTAGSSPTNSSSTRFVHTVDPSLPLPDHLKPAPHINYGPFPLELLPGRKKKTWDSMLAKEYFKYVAATEEIGQPLKNIDKHAAHIGLTLEACGGSEEKLHEMKMLMWGYIRQQPYGKNKAAKRAEKLKKEREEREAREAAEASAANGGFVSNGDCNAKQGAESVLKSQPDITPATALQATLQDPLSRVVGINDPIDLTMSDDEV